MPTVMNDEVLADEIFGRYQALQLTTEQKRTAQARDEELARQAGHSGAYRRLEEIAGTVKWSISWQALRMEA
jgi:hypothetical protein